MKNLLLLKCLPLPAKWFIDILWRTVRCDVIGTETLQRLWGKGQNVIIIFWHDQLLLMVKAYPGKGAKVLISPSGDGEIIARIMEQFGHGTVRGSSSRQGLAALKKMIEISKQNCDIAITPDGPRGPRHKLKPGTAQLSRLTKMPVVCGSIAYSRGYRFSSWDRFLLPFPFSRAVYSVSDPLFFEKTDSLDSFQVRLEEAMEMNQSRACELLEEYGLHPV